MSPVKKKKTLVDRLRNKYRLVILNDDTFEEKFSLRLSRLNVFVVAGSIILTLITLTIYLIAFTPLREYIPGYADLNMQRNVYRLSLLADSLEQELTFRDQYIINIRNVIDGRIESDTASKKAMPSEKTEAVKLTPRSASDSLLRAMVENEDRYELSHKEAGGSGNTGIRSFFFFTPLKGTITSVYKVSEKHYGVDIVSTPNAGIKATLDGTVILSNWTNETGYVISIQHPNNIVSIYKHNSALLKKAGDYVKAGEPIAIIGNTGELSSGPHLHFELWYNGTPVNPADYISF